LILERWVSLAAAVESNALAAWLRSSAWGYPAVETLHIAGLAVLVGTAVAFDLRLLGAASLLPVDGVARFLLPLARIGFGVAVVSGLVLFMMQARTFAVMPLFFLKMATVAIAVTNTMIFHRGIFASAGEWSRASRTPRRARVAAVVSLVCWMLALACGRFLAYV
jgi:hypothetical protein